MHAATQLPVTVKCRIGVDNDDQYGFLHRFVDLVARQGGVQHYIVHARKALLQGGGNLSYFWCAVAYHCHAGLSPAQNRTVPPLRYDVVHRLAKDFSQLQFSINGGFTTVAAVQEQLTVHQLHGVMVGRRACETPSFLSVVGNASFFVVSVARISHSLFHQTRPSLEATLL
jgi:tRNA-dihydrouridine synthase A